MKKLLFVFALLSVYLFYPTDLQATPGVSIFDRFPWLVSSNLVDPSACTAGNCPVEKIDVYRAGAYDYLLITDANGGAKLYNQSGQFYCQNFTNYDCVAAYGFGPPIDTWRSNSGSTSLCVVDEQKIHSLRERDLPISQITQIDYKGARYFETILGPEIQDFLGDVQDCGGRVICSYSIFGSPPDDYNPEVCNAVQTGQGVQTVIWTRPESTCSVVDPFSLPAIQEAINRRPLTNSDGEICLFVEEIVQLEYNGSTYFRINQGTTNGSPSCSVGFHDEFYDCEGKFVGSTYLGPTCQSPQLCDGLYNATASGTVIWSFDDEQLSSTDQLFMDYPWLTNSINPASCTGEKVDVYQSGIYSYLLVTKASGDVKLYNQGGQFYCQQAPNYDCVAAYGFGDPVDRWACGSSSR